jgi:hypothetical protein
VVWTIGVLGFDSRRVLGIFLFTTASRTALRPTQPPIQWVPGAPSPGVKRPGREADRSPPSSAEVKNAWSYTSTPQYVLMAWCLVKHRHIARLTSSSYCASHVSEDHCFVINWLLIHHLSSWFRSCVFCLSAISVSNKLH